MPLTIRRVRYRDPDIPSGPSGRAYRPRRGLLSWDEVRRKVSRSGVQIPEVERATRWLELLTPRFRRKQSPERLPRSHDLAANIDARMFTRADLRPTQRRKCRGIERGVRPCLPTVLGRPRCSSPGCRAFRSSTDRGNQTGAPRSDACWLIAGWPGEPDDERLTRPPGDARRRRGYRRVRPVRPSRQGRMCLRGRPRPLL